LIATPAWYGFAVLAFVAGFARGLSGFGIALIMMPLTASLYTPRVAVPIMMLIDLIPTLLLFRNARHHVNAKEISVLSLAAFAGIPLGVSILVYLDADTMRTVISALVVLAAIALAAGFRISGKPSALRDAVTGFLSGLFSGSASLPAPPVIIGWTAAQVPGQVLRSNIICYFAALTLVQAPVLWYSGLFTAKALILGITAAPIFGIGVYAGAHSFPFIPEKLFRQLVLVVIGVGAVFGLISPLYGR
jgi:uncharacterized membrane protein YfcA